MPVVDVRGVASGTFASFLSLARPTKRQLLVDAQWRDRFATMR